jgi:hypothetical protein
VADVTLQVFGLLDCAGPYEQESTLMFTARLGLGARF